MVSAQLQLARAIWVWHTLGRDQVTGGADLCKEMEDMLDQGPACWQGLCSGVRSDIPEATRLFLTVLQRLGADAPRLQYLAHQKHVESG